MKQTKRSIDENKESNNDKLNSFFSLISLKILNLFKSKNLSKKNQTLFQQKNQFYLKQKSNNYPTIFLIFFNPICFILSIK